MSLIGLIDKIPLYSTLQEAEIWAKQYNLTGYHTHSVLGQVGYMGGTNHAAITAAMRRGVVNPIQPTELRSVTNQSLPNNTGSSSSSGGGGGGY